MFRLLVVGFFLIMLSSMTKAQDDSACETVLFPDELVSSLSWHREDEIRVSLEREQNNVTVRQYKIIRFDASRAVEILEALLPEIDTALEIVFQNGLGNEDAQSSHEFHLLVSPNGQYAIYTQRYGYYLIDIQAGTMRLLVMPSPPTSPIEVVWLSDEVALIVSQPIYGIGVYVDTICLERLCAQRLSDQIDDVVGTPSVSASTGVIAYPSGIELSKVYLQYLDNVREIASIELDFSLFADMPLTWSQDGRSLYALENNSEQEGQIIRIDVLEKGYSTYRVAAVGETAYQTRAWLVDEANEVSFHALDTGGIRIICW